MWGAWLYWQKPLGGVMSKRTWGFVVWLTIICGVALRGSTDPALRGLTDSIADIFGENVLSLTIIGSVVSPVVIIIAWKLSGWWIRKRNVPAPSRSAENRLLGLSFVFILVLFFTIPGVTEDHGSIRDGTIMYFLCLCPVLLMIVVYHAVSYRRQPSQQSAFIVGLGLLAGTLTIIGVILSALAVSSYYYT